VAIEASLRRGKPLPHIRRQSRGDRSEFPRGKPPPHIRRHSRNQTPWFPFDICQFSALAGELFRHALLRWHHLSRESNGTEEGAAIFYYLPSILTPHSLGVIFLLWNDPLNIPTSLRAGGKASMKMSRSR